MQNRFENQARNLGRGASADGVCATGLADEADVNRLFTEN
jgi:hypothetical protein